MRASRLVFAFVLVLATDRTSAGEAAVQILACREDLRCARLMDAVEGADFVWLWSDDAAPLRVLPGEVKATLARGLEPSVRTTIEVQRRGDAPVRLIAAPAQMWTEVPETLLPAFEVPQSGIVRVPRTAAVPWKARLAGPGVGSWWTPLARGSTAIVLLPATPRRLRVTRDDGAPLASAAVAIATPRAGTARALDAQLSTDRAGWFEIEGLPDREPLTLIVGAAGYAPAALTERLPQLPERIELRAGHRVTGRFVDAEEKPLAGVHVRAEAWLSSSGAVVQRETSSDGSGSWTIAALPDGVRAVVVATRKGLASLREEVVVAKDLDLGDRVLQKGTTLSVRVLDPDQRPIPAARVRARPARDATSDTNGVVRLVDLSQTAALDLSVSADGYLPATVQLSPPFDALTDVELTRAFVVTGRFVDAAGQVIDGAIARVVTGESFRDVALDDGTFRISAPPDRAVTIEVAAPASKIVRLEVEGKAGETRDLGAIRADDGFSVRGTIVTADGAPVAAASVWTPRMTAAGPLVDWASGNVVRAETDAEGTFVLRGGGPEPVLLRVDAPGFARAFRSVAFDADAHDVHLGEVALAKGVTVTVNGRPDMSDAIARLAFRPETGDVDVLTTAMRDGVATIRNAPPGRAVVTVHRGHSTICRREVDIVEREAAVAVDCAAGAVRVRGTVLVGQRAADGGSLVWTSPSDVPVAGLIVNNTTGLGALMQQSFGASSDVLSTVAANGEFTSDDLQPGRWLVRWTSPAGGTTVPREVVIDERPDVTVVLRYEDAHVRGIVVDEHSRPVRHASVRQLNGTAEARTGDDGTFTIVGLAQGTHRFRAEHRDLKSDTSAVEIESGRQPDPLRLVLRTGESDTLVVRVETADRTAAAGALVFVETSAGEMRIVTTGKDGRVAVAFDDGVPASARCSAIHDGRWTFGDWRPVSARDDGIKLRLGDTGELVVRSEEHEGTLDIRTPHGWNLRMLLLRIGSVPLLSPNVPLRIAGLPAGDYEVSIGTVATRATVRRGETVTVTLPRR